MPPKEPSHFWMWVSLASGCLIASGLAFLFLVDAAPPTHIVIATGSKEGAYFRYAQKYAELLAQDGVVVDVRSTKGSVENVELLLEEEPEVDVAFVQGGIADPTKSDSLQSLCSLYREPLWIFHRGTEPLTELTQLQGKRTAIGPEGSGTRAIVRQLLEASGLDISQPEFLPTSGKDAASALQAGEIDAAFFVSGVEASHIQALINSPEIRLANLSRTDAYVRRFRFLSPVNVPAGLLDMKNVRPAEDTTLLAPAATLVVRKSFHPALIAVLLKAAVKVHRNGDMLTNPGEFPSTAFTDLPISEDADRFFRFGPPVLQRILPFWMASLIDRMKLMIIPLIMLLMPLVRAAPPLVRWRTRRKIYLWYHTLRQIDQKAIHGMSPTEAKSSLDGLRVLEQQIALVGVPLSYMEEYYNLRLHLNLVRSRVESIVNQGWANVIRA